MKLSRYQPSDAAYTVFTGHGQVNVSLNPEMPRGLTGFLPYQAVRVSAQGAFTPEGSDTVGHGVLVDHWEPEHKDAVSDFLWQGAKVMFWCWLFGKVTQ